MQPKENAVLHGVQPDSIFYMRLMSANGEAFYNLLFSPVPALGRYKS